MTAAIAQLEKALSLAMTLQQSGDGRCRECGYRSAKPAEPDAEQADRAGLLAYAEKGAGARHPQSLQLSAGKDLIATAGRMPA
jgi:type VI secretion system secreted protein VgrG